MATHTLPSEYLYVNVVEEVASREGVSPVDLPPFYDSVDTEIFDALTLSESDNTQVVFTYCGYKVMADRDGHITVTGGD